MKMKDVEDLMEENLKNASVSLPHISIPKGLDNLPTKVNGEMSINEVQSLSIGYDNRALSHLMDIE
jgi:hypothetical protein